MKKYFFAALVLFVIAFNLNLFSQAPEIMWTRTIGSTNPDQGNSVQETDDGGFIIAGSTYIGGGGGYQVWLVKTDSTGNPLWTKTYGDILSDVALCVNKTSDGGFIVTGSMGVPAAGGISDAFLLRVDYEGNTVWHKTFGNPGDNEVGNFTEQCSDGGFILAGAIIDTSDNSSDFLVIKTDSLGNTEWLKTYGGNSYEEAYCIKQVSPVGYIISGITDSYGSGGYDVWVLRIDDTGNTLWARPFGGISTDLGYSILQTPDGGFVVSGSTGSFGSGSLDAWLIRLNNAGDTLWTKTYGGVESEGGTSIQQTTNNGFIITGWTDSFGSGFDDVFLIRTNESGDTLWTKVSGGSSEERGQSVCQISDGGYIVVGYTRSFGSGNGDVYLIRVGPEITVPVELSSFTAAAADNVVVLNWITATENNNRGFEIERSQKSKVKSQIWEKIGFLEGYGTTTESKNYSLTDKNVSVGSYKYRLKQVDFDGTFVYSPEVEVEISSPTEFVLHQNYPNPFNPTTKISWQSPDNSWQTLKIFDVLGNEVSTLVNEFKNAGSYEMNFDAGNLPSGVYFYRLETGNFTNTKKLILMR